MKLVHVHSPWPYLISGQPIPSARTTARLKGGCQAASGSALLLSLPPFLVTVRRRSSYILKQESLTNH